jgi:hypothetical protein
MEAGQYVVTSKTGDSKWHETNAKTLRGAKMAASRMYETSLNGSIEVGIARDYASIDIVAYKHGLDKWLDC